MIFKIEWDDPTTGERKEVYEDYEDTPTVTAVEWAEDAAYSYADKGWHKVTAAPSLKLNPRRHV